MRDLRDQPLVTTQPLCWVVFRALDLVNRCWTVTVHSTSEFDVVTNLMFEPEKATLYQLNTKGERD